LARYRFAQDDDGHWYLIPVELEILFFQMQENGEADGWCEFNNKFYEYSTGCSPSCYTFTNPEER
jgi:hypothetical protein